MLGAGVPVITCMSREKARYAAPGHVWSMIAKPRGAMGKAGGIFIHHRDAGHTIDALTSLGIAPELAG